MSKEVLAENEESGFEKARRPARETAPSYLREDEPAFPRWAALISLIFMTLGGLAVLLHARERQFLVGPVLGGIFCILGLSGLLFHAAREDGPLRWIYGVVGFLFLAAAAFFAAWPVEGSPGILFLPYGAPCLTLSLLFLLPYVRNETDARLRGTSLFVIGAVGAVLALTGFIAGNINENFLMPYGLLLALLGLAYLWAFLGIEGTSSDLGSYAALAVGVAGLVFFLLALGRTVLPALFYALKWIQDRPEPYLIPSGLLLMLLGLFYAGLAVGLHSENRLAVLTRRELAAFFYSPIAYIVLFGMTFVGWLVFAQFVTALSDAGGPMEQRAVIPEPIVVRYIVSWWSVICTIFVVPVLTMKLLSEEQRTGTLEVLFTAPVPELAVVLSKFLAAFLFFMLAWIPWGLFLIALRAEGAQPFEYRPLLSFLLAQACSGAAFLSMGLFFSSLTRNQIASAILCFVGMVFLTGLFFAVANLERSTASNAVKNLIPVFDVASYITLWINSVEGRISPRHLIFQVSFAAFWLFLTVKVLESRKWR